MNQMDIVFIFAASEEDAIHFYTRIFHQTPLNSNEYLLDFQLAIDAPESKSPKTWVQL